LITTNKLSEKEVNSIFPFVRNDSPDMKS